MNCPVCHEVLAHGELVMVCGPCHGTLSAEGGSISVGHTGEFRVLPSELLEREVGGERPIAVASCAWCRKPEADVRKLLGRSGVALCDECIALCCDILDAELGRWR